MVYKQPNFESIYGKEAIYDALWEQEGEVKAAALKLQCSRNGLYSYLDENPEANEFRKKAKKYFRMGRVEDCEKLLIERQEQRKSLPTSFAAIKYYLDTHGKEEGWGNEEDESQSKVDGKLAQSLDLLLKMGSDDREPQQEAD